MRSGGRIQLRRPASPNQADSVRLTDSTCGHRRQGLFPGLSEGLTDGVRGLLAENIVPFGNDSPRCGPIAVRGTFLCQAMMAEVMLTPDTSHILVVRPGCRVSSGVRHGPQPMLAFSHYRTRRERIHGSLTIRRRP